MFCTQCGKALIEQNTFCTHCGAPRVVAAGTTKPDPVTPAAVLPVQALPVPPAVGAASPTETSRQKTSLLLGIVALVCLGGWVAYITTTASQNLTDALPNGIVEATNPAAIRVKANAGDAEAQNNLGYVYADGRGVPQDDAQAVSWFRQAAEQGHADAQNNLGWMYDSGQGVPQDDAQAVSWYRQAAEQGDAGAQSILDRMSRYRSPSSVEVAPNQIRVEDAADRDKAAGKRRKP